VGTFANKTAIVGIGQTEFSKNSGRSPLQLAAEAALAALEDAGLKPTDVDGLVAFTVEDNEENDLIQTLGIPGLSWSARIGLGGGGSAGSVFHAAAAIASGAANTVLLFRAFNERSGSRFGTGMSAKGVGVGGWHGSGFNSVIWGLPFGVMTPATMISMAALPYMKRYGVTNEDFGHHAVVSRGYAATNPTAWFHERPITLADHQASRWIIEPVCRLLDCCQESDGGVAIVMTSLERARDLKQVPAVVRGGAQDIRPSGYLGLSARTSVMAERLYRSASLKPEDISAALLYDAFAPEVFHQLEALGFCADGEAKHFIRGGETKIDGKLPINMNGGLTGEAYIHGMNNITEAVRQIRGTAANQVNGVDHVLVSSGASAHILGRA
jgi:acetyl-CoA acetyltransferase